MGISPDEEQQQNEALAFERFERAMLAGIDAVQANSGIVVIDFDAVINQQDQQGEV